VRPPCLEDSEGLRDPDFPNEANDTFEGRLEAINRLYGESRIAEPGEESSEESSEDEYESEAKAFRALVAVLACVSCLCNGRVYPFDLRDRALLASRDIYGSVLFPSEIVAAYHEAAKPLRVSMSGHVRNLIERVDEAILPRQFGVFVNILASITFSFRHGPEDVATAKLPHRFAAQRVKDRARMLRRAADEMEKALYG
jgi:hypothetical protein